MKLVIFGLAVSSSWGNGHAVLWRALIRAFGALGHYTVFFERDVPYYAQNRDLTVLQGGRLVLYDHWEEVLPEAKRELAGADAAIVTSYCPDAPAATEVVLDAPALHLFYDLDTPVTLSQLAEGRAVPYIGPDGLAPFDLVLSTTDNDRLRPQNPAASFVIKDRDEVFTFDQKFGEEKKKTPRIVRRGPVKIGK